MSDPRTAVSLGCRVLGREELGDLVWGHVSMRDPGGRGVWIKAAKLGFEEVGPHDVHLLDWEGRVIEGEGQRHAEFPIHTEVIAARPDVGAVVHTHAPFAVALAATAQPLLPISHDATMFVPPDVPRFEETGNLILTPDLGRSVAATMGECSTVFLVNHGIVTAGADVPSAVVATIVLEKACRMQLRAGSAREIKKWSNDEEALAKRKTIYFPENVRLMWDYLVRRLD